MQCENHRETDKRGMTKKSNFFTYQPRPFQVRTSKNKPSPFTSKLHYRLFLSEFFLTPSDMLLPMPKINLTSIFLMKYLLKISSIFSCFIKKRPLNLVVPISFFKCIFFFFLDNIKCIFLNIFQGDAILTALTCYLINRMSSYIL